MQAHQGAPSDLQALTCTTCLSWWASCFGQSAEMATLSHARAHLPSHTLPLPQPWYRFLHPRMQSRMATKRMWIVGGPLPQSALMDAIVFLQAIAKMVFVVAPTAPSHARCVGGCARLGLHTVLILYPGTVSSHAAPASPVDTGGSLK